MRHTKLAHDVHNLLSLLTHIIVLATLAIAQQSQTKVLDLTKPPVREQQETGLPGISVGGIGGEPLPRSHRLPLRIHLVSVDPKPEKIGDKFTVELHLRNDGKTAFLLPASQNSVAVLHQKGTGRRNFEFGLIYWDPKNGRQVSSIAAVAAGSDTTHGSLLRIEPGGEVRVLFTADLRPIASWFGHNLDEIQIRAEASETSFEDNRYFVRSKSEEIVSENEQTLNLTRP